MKTKLCTVLTVGVLALAAPQASALEHAEVAPKNAESSAVAALKMGKVGSFGDCTGTLIDEQWILSARHCLMSVRNEGTQARIGGEIYDVDSWAVSQTADIGLLHVNRKVEGVQPAPLASEIPQAGEEGNFYGWSSSSTMARKGQLPVARMKVNEVLGGAPMAPAAPMTPAAPAEIIDDGSGQLSIPAGGMGDSIAMTGGTILDVQSLSRAGAQGGDSGGPFFVAGKLAGVATANTAVGDPNLPSNGVAVTTVAESLEWINAVISGQEDPGPTPEPPATVQTSSTNAAGFALVALVGLIVAAVGSRRKTVRRK